MPEAARWTPLHVRVHRTIRARQLFEPGQALLVAVSGGQDSLCLAKLLLDLRPKWDWHVGVAHCNHAWRPDSRANADHVAKLVEDWYLPYYLVTAEQPAKSEAAARQWRYQTLVTLARQHHYTNLVTGHTASDRAETLLYNLLRGSGADGLQALTWKRSLGEGVQLARPLLEATRRETAAFCQELGLPVWEDTTNQDLHYARNRIRQELMPYLEQHFNPRVQETLAQTAELLRADVDYLETAARSLLQEAIAAAETPVPQQFGLNRRLLQTAPLALQRRVVRQFLQQMLPIAPSFVQVEKLTALITAPNRSQTDPFPGGAIAQVQEPWIWLRTKDSTIP